MKIIVSGLINIETTVKIDKFPIPYFPIDYPFYGIKSNIAGVAYNVAKAFLVLGNDVELLSFIGKDEEGDRIKNRLMQDGISYQYVLEELEETPASVILFDKEGKRQIYCDLKEIQEKQLDYSKLEQKINDADILFLSDELRQRSAKPMLLKYLLTSLTHQRTSRTTMTVF